MPKTIRELKALLKKSGFKEFTGKGSHTKWLHPRYPGRITLSGKDSNDAKIYQEKEILAAIKIVNQGD